MINQVPINFWVVNLSQTSRKTYYGQGVMLKDVGNGHGDHSLNVRQDCVSYNTKTLQKDVNSVIFSAVMGK